LGPLRLRARGARCRLGRRDACERRMGYYDLRDAPLVWDRGSRAEDEMCSRETGQRIVTRIMLSIFVTLISHFSQVNRICSIALHPPTDPDHVPVLGRLLLVEWRNS
jgi:hypothetical protein